jgi:type I restriction enzyme S subunit
MVIIARDTKLKQGYKQTEVGVIPEDWRVCSLGDIVTKVGSGITPTGGEKVYKKEGHPFLRSQNVGWGYLLLDDIAFLDEETHHSFLATEIKLYDVLLNIAGASIGRSAVADDRLVGGNVNQHVCIIRADTSKLNPHYLNYFLLSERGQKQIDSFQAGGNRQGLNFGQIRSFQIPLPPLPEQRAFAIALSDIDALIKSLDKLIAKKRDIKQATMQLLLAGKTRLPGFNSEWQLFNLADNSTLKARIGLQGLTTAEYLREGEYYLVTGTDFIDGKIDWDTCHFVDPKRYGQDKNIQLQIGDVLLTKDGTIGKVAYIDHLPGAATLNSGVFVIRPKNNKYYSLYLYYVLSSSIFDEFLQQLKAGSTISHLYQRDFVGFNFWAPSWEEQEAIANILSDMDAEIAALEQKRDKTRALKQGMMQELLTGKTRLI